MSNREQGFTLIELMIVVAMIAIFSSAAIHLMVQVRNEHQQVSGYQRDVLEVRRALTEIEAWLRGATTVDRTDEGILIHVNNEAVTLSCDNNQLTAARTSRSRVLARCVRQLSIETEDALAHVCITLRPRNQLTNKEGARITTSVRLRNWREGR